MGVILFGCGVVWGVVTGLTHGNWQAGLVVALVVLTITTSERRAQQATETTAQRRLLIVEEEPEPIVSRRSRR